VKKHLFLLFLTLGLAFAVIGSAGAETTWETNLKKAQDQAKTGHKFLLVDFTGSDWCGWCKRLNAEVFSQPQFKEYAAKNLVLLEIDFPRRKTQTMELKKQNEELAGQYQIMGFPTIIVLNSDGKKIGELGYTPGGPGAFIAELEKLRKG
jgi:thioredoxin-related protein